MSGGYFNYINITLSNLAEDLKTNHENYYDTFQEELQTNVKELFHQLVKLTTDYIYDIDYHLSGDSIIHDQNEFYHKYLAKLIAIANRNESTLVSELLEENKKLKTGDLKK
jgi:hypothetical protein